MFPPLKIRSFIIWKEDENLIFTSEVFLFLRMVWQCMVATVLMMKLSKQAHSEGGVSGLRQSTLAKTSLDNKQQVSD